MKKVIISIFAVMIMVSAISAKPKHGIDTTKQLKYLLIGEDGFYVHSLIYDQWKKDHSQGFVIPGRVGDNSWRDKKVDKKLSAGPVIKEDSWYSKAWAWFYKTFFHNDINTKSWMGVLGAVILTVTGLLVIFAIVKIIKKLIYLFSYLGLSEVQGIAVITDNAYSNDDEDETEVDDDVIVEGYDFQFELTINDIEQSFWVDVDQETYNKFRDNDIVTILYKIGRNKKLKLIDVPQFKLV